MKQKVIYTIKNTETNEAYVGQTTSFATRVVQHMKNGLREALSFPIKVPLWILIRSGKALLEIFLTDNANADERKQWKKTKDEGRKMKNKTFKD